jgi:hypothetical protein
MRRGSLAGAVLLTELDFSYTVRPQRPSKRCLFFLEQFIESNIRKFRDNSYD